MVLVVVVVEGQGVRVLVPAAEVLGRVTVVVAGRVVLMVEVDVDVLVTCGVDVTFSVSVGVLVTVACGPTFRLKARWYANGRPSPLLPNRSSKYAPDTR